MFPLEPEAQRALDRYTGMYRARVVDIAIALARGSTITRSNIELAQRLADTISDAPKTRPIVPYAVGQFGSFLAGGAVGALITPSQYTIAHAVFLVAGLCFMIAGYERAHDG